MYTKLCYVKSEDPDRIPRFEPWKKNLTCQGQSVQNSRDPVYKHKPAWDKCPHPP